MGGRPVVVCTFKVEVKQWEEAGIEGRRQGGVLRKPARV